MRMRSSCPECGAELEVTEAPAKVLSGECVACGHGVTVLQGVRPPASPAGAGTPAGGPESEAAAEGNAPSLECAECGEGVEISAPAEGVLETVCTGCGAQARYALAGEEAEAPKRRPRFERIERPRSDDRSDRPPSRPCRECGGPLTFSTSPDGGVTGECSSCGNRFTLPARREGREGGGRRPFPGRSGGGYRRSYGGSPGWRGGGSSDSRSDRGERRPYSRGGDRSGGERRDRRRRRDRDDG